jgi:hypothetical protein
MTAFATNACHCQIVPGIEQRRTMMSYDLQAEGDNGTDYIRWALCSLANAGLDATTITSGGEQTNVAYGSDGE